MIIVRKLGKICMTCLAAAAMMIASSHFPIAAHAAEAETWSDSAVFFTFTDDAVSVTGAEEGYSVDGTEVIIEAEGDYVFQGNCSNGNIQVKKNSGEVNIYLNGLILEAQEEGTCPLNLKGGSNEITITAVDGTENSLSDCDHSQATPKSVINASAAVIINGGGSITIDANNKNGIKSDTDLTIEDNVELTVKSVGDGIVADENLTITGGNISIETNGGCNTVLSDDADSCKAIKSDSKITITGGKININSADDAIHSGEYIYLLGGNMEIATGDDGAHADTSLFLGSEAGGCPTVTVKNSYEGLEAGTVYIYSGDVDINATDDGINAAGGSDSTDQESGNFNPGGGTGGGPSRGGFGGFGQNSGFGGNGGNPDSSSTGDYSINIYGGDLYVEAEGDGVDANGDINMSGGKLIVFGAASNGTNSDNSALDYDGSCLVTGGILFAAGSNSGVGSIVPSGGSQAYSVAKTTVTKGSYINVYEGNTAVFSVLAPKQVNHCVYSAPSGSGWSFQTGTAAAFSCAHINTEIRNKAQATCVDNSYSGDTYCTDCGALIEAGAYGDDATGTHTWDDGVVTSEATEDMEGSITYTCTVCGASKTETIPKTVNYTATFVTDAGASIDVFYTQDYTSASESSVEKAIARNSDTGEADNSGSGQINFRVNLKDGYSLVKVTVTPEGSYKNLKGSEDTEVENIYRVTKVTGNLTITVVTEKTGQDQDQGQNQGQGQDQGQDQDIARKTLGKVSVSKISTTSKGIQIRWSKVQGATGYIIYRGKAGGSLSKYKTINVADTLTFTDKSVKNGVKYQYKIRAYAQEGSTKIYGSYSAVKTRYFVSRPTIKKLTNSATKKLTVKWSKNSKVSGYQICYSTSKKFTSSKTVTVKKKTILSKVLKGLKKNKTYYVRVRGYKKVSGKTYYGAWSAVKSVKIRK